MKMQHVAVAGLLTLGFFLCGATAWGQAPGVQKMVIQNGPNRAVYLFGHQVLESDQAILRNLARAEREMHFAEQLAGNRQQYLNYDAAQKEVTLDWLKRLAGDSYLVRSGWDAYGNFIYMRETARNWPFQNGYSSFAAIGSEAGGPLCLGGSAIDKEMAKTIAMQATPEYYAKVSQDYVAALGQASQSELLAKELNLGNDKRIVSLAALPQGDRPFPALDKGQAHVALIDGRDIIGKVVKEDDDRIVVDDNGTEREIRKKDTKVISKKK